MPTTTATCDLLVRASLLLTQNPERTSIEDAAVAVSQGRIIAMGKRSDLVSFHARKTLELGNSLLMPGLVNAHTHVSMTVFRGLADDLPLMDWLTQHIFPRERRLTAEIVELGALLGCAEMIRTGTTAFADMYLIEDAVAAAVDRSGQRALLGEGIFAFPSLSYATIEEGFSLIREQVERYAGHPRLRLVVSPHAVYTTTPEIMAASRELAQELGLPMQIHLSETKSEVDACLASHGRRPVAYCGDLGLLGPGTTVAHVVEVTDEELDMLAQTGVHVAHNPRSNMKLSSGIAPVPGMLKRGMLPGLGTDGAASNNTLNMFAEMSACALLHKVCGQDPTVCPANVVLDMATLGSAASLGWPELGQLVVGGPADMIALDLDSPNLQPLHNPVSQLVYAASGHEVRLNMVGGNILYKDGRHTSLDYPILLKEMAGIKKWMAKLT